MSMTYVAFDIEATGLSAFNDRICEFGAVRFSADGTVLETIQSLVQPSKPSSPNALAAHGLSDELLATAPLPRDVLPKFRDFLGHHRDVILLAHNAEFDLGFLRVAFAELNLPEITHETHCTLDLARRKWRFPSYKLSALADRFNFPTDQCHRALADAERVRLLWLILQRS